MTVGDGVGEPNRFDEIGSVLTTRGEEASALLAEAREIKETARDLMDAGRGEEARSLLDQAKTLTKTASAEAQEVHRLMSVAGQARAAAEQGADDLVALDAALRTRMWAYAEQGDTGIRWALDELVKRDTWWKQQNR